MSQIQQPRVYSYIRISSDIQAKAGRDGIRRQSQLAIDYCEKHDLTLDTEFNLRDIGVSAFRSSHIQGGNLGLFLEAIRQNKIPSGSILLIESLDRLSRDQVLTALSTFNQIVQADITIITLADNRTYTKENINDIGNLMYSLIIMSRAHEESAIKSMRLKASWSKKRKDAESGKAITKRIPAWLLKNGENYQVIQERADLIKKIFNMSLSGMGQNYITGWLNQNRIPTWGDGENGNRKGKGWQASYIKKLMNDSKVIGWYTPGIMQDGKRILQEPILNHYPAIIPEKLYYDVQVAIASRYHKSGRIGSTVNVFQGLLFCNCGASLVRVNRGKKDKVKMYCDHYRRKMSNCSGNLRFDVLQKDIIDTLKNIDVKAMIRERHDNDGDIQAKILTLMEQKSVEEKKLETFLTALEIGNIQILVNKMKETEALIQTLEQEIEKLNTSIFSTQQQFESAKLVVELLEFLCSPANTLTHDDNLEWHMRARKYLNLIIDKIVVNLDKKTFDIYF